ncbi:MAG: hypothetical protein O3A63_15085 [Proteobacteria bacterium]|nr:hypothetical protein [Pseudomonadota bacterium]
MPGFNDQRADLFEFPVVAAGRIESIVHWQRSFEYDSLTPLYGHFLKDELVPFAAETTGVSFIQDASLRAICGISSGGICAFNTLG